MIDSLGPRSDHRIDPGRTPGRKPRRELGVVTNRLLFTAEVGYIPFSPAAGRSADSSICFSGSSEEDDQ
jgi:hypothetical protein